MVISEVSSSTTKTTGFIDVYLQLSAKTAGNVVLGPLRKRRLKDHLGVAVFDQTAEIHEGGVVGDARRLLHVVRDDNDGVDAGKLMDQLFDLGGGDRVQGR